MSSQRPQSSQRGDEGRIQGGGDGTDALVRWLLGRTHHSVRREAYTVTVTADNGEAMSETHPDWGTAVRLLMERNNALYAPPESAVENESTTETETPTETTEPA